MDMRIAIVAARFNELVTKALVEGAQSELEAMGVPAERSTCIWVPGSFELPLAAKAAAESGRFDAIVCIGAVIRGETDHYEFVAREAARGLMDVSLTSGIPVSFGVLTTATAEQALARCGLKGGNKGREVAAAAVTMVRTLRQLKRE